ncbi:hypothetical protein ACWIEX_08600 [Bosea sp. NPDC055353]
MMIDTLLQFADEVAAIGLLTGYHSDGEWAGEFLPVAVVTAEAVFGEPDEDGVQVVIAKRSGRASGCSPARRISISRPRSSPPRSSARPGGSAPAT